jgi:CesT_Tir_1
MRTDKDVEAYLRELGRRYRRVEGETATFVVESSANVPPVGVRVDPPLVVVRVHVGDVSASDTGSKLLRKLLELNARQLVHTSYGLDGEHVVLSSALELENLDFNELQATLDEIDMALAQDLPGLSPALPQRSSDKGS